MTAAPRRLAERLMVIGLDGATLDVLAPLAEQGVLPNLSHWLRGGAATPLLSTLPSVTPVAWSTFLTGCDPAGHGVWDFRRLDSRTGQLRLHDATSLQRPTLYDRIAHEGGQTVSIDLPMTWPQTTPRVGIILGGFDSPSRAATLSAHPRLAEALRRARVELSLETVWKRPPRTWEELAAGAARTEVHFGERVTAAAVCDRLSDWRLMVVQFQALDALQHRCFHLLGSGGSQGGQTAPRRWVERTQAVLRTLDECVGRLCDMAAQRGASVLVVSDHGFGAFRGEIRVNEILRRAGLQRAPSGMACAGNWIERAAWKMGRWRARQKQVGGSLARLPRPALAELQIDARRSVASSLHGDLAALIYVHTPSRFTGGTVLSSQQYEQTLADVQGTLLEQSDPVSGDRLFVDVRPMATEYDVDVVERGWPDLMALAADGFHTASKPGPRGSIVTTDAALTGTHRRAGVLLAEPWLTDGVAQRGAVAHLRDVAPTILSALGVSAWTPMDGRPLLQSDGQAAAAQSKAVAGLSSRLCVAAAQDVPAADSGSQFAVERRLRALGYLN